METDDCKYLSVITTLGNTRTFKEAIGIRTTVGKLLSHPGLLDFKMALNRALSSRLAFKHSRLAHSLLL